MLSKLRLLGIILYLTTCIDVVYGNEIHNIKDLSDDNIPVKDKLEYLESIKNNSFSEKDIDILIDVCITNSSDEDSIEAFNNIKVYHGEKPKKIKQQDIKIMDSLRVVVLNILLRPDINENILTQSQMSMITNLALDELRFYPDLPKARRYLSLKLLIKMNELKTNTDDGISEMGRSFAKDLVSNDPDLLEELGTMEDLHEKQNFWDFRATVEEYIFDPILLKFDSFCLDEDRENNYYRTENKEILEEYEEYLLEHLKFFPIDSYLQKLVEEAFLNTQFKQFRSKYIDAMFSLNMRVALVNIILNKSIDLNLRKQAIEVSVKLLNEVEVLHRKNFSTNLLRIIQDISSDVEEAEEIRKVAQEKIEIIQSYINKHDDIKDLEYIIFNPNISNKNKIVYINDFLRLTKSFLKENLGFMKRVLDDENLNIKVKARIATMVMFRTKSEDLSDIFSDDDRLAMGFLWHYVDEDGLDIFNKVFNSKMNFVVWSFHNAVYLTDEEVIKYASRFDQWDVLMDYMNGGVEDTEDSVRKLAIKTSLDFLAKTKNFESLSKDFLENLQIVSDNTQDSVELRNISDYILHAVKEGKLSLKDGSTSCILKFIF